MHITPQYVWKHNTITGSVQLLPWAAWHFSLNFFFLLICKYYAYNSWITLEVILLNQHQANALYHHDMHICWFQHWTWTTKSTKECLSSPFPTSSNINQGCALFFPLKVNICLHSDFVQIVLCTGGTRRMECYCVKSIYIFFSHVNFKTSQRII